MKQALFKRESAVACRNCGAEEAPQEDDAKYGMCASCFLRYRKYCQFGNHPDSDNRANTWIARQLFLSAKRLDKYGVTGRCEAITNGTLVEYMMDHGPGSGFQCARPATGLREGRRVCHSHGRISIRVMFVAGGSGGVLNVYDEFERIVRELGSCDPLFREAALRGASAILATVRGNDNG